MIIITGVKAETVWCTLPLTEEATAQTRRSGTESVCHWHGGGYPEPERWHQRSHRSCTDLQQQQQTNKQMRTKPRGDICLHFNWIAMIWCCWHHLWQSWTSIKWLPVYDHGHRQIQKALPVMAIEWGFQVKYLQSSQASVLAYIIQYQYWFWKWSFPL